MPRLCILTQYFPPEMGAPQARLSELGERLIDAGWEVEALTALPNYPTGAVFDAYDPLQPCVETIGRIRTIRVPLYTAKSGFLKRLRSYFSFVRSAKRHGPALCNRPDLIYAESPPLFIGYAAMALARRWRCPYVFNVSDLWPESAIRMGVIKPGLASRMAERLELKLYRKAAGVTGQSSEIIDSVIRRSPKTVTEVITNGVDPARFGKRMADAEARKLIGDEPGPVFIFAGLLGRAQGIDQILDVAKNMPDWIPGRFVLVGEGTERERLAARIVDEEITRVRLAPAQPRDRVPAILGAADVAIISLGMSIPGAVPSKIYEAMASNLPILLIADGEPARRIEEAGCGVCVRPGDLKAAQEHVTELARNAQLRERLGAAGRVAAETVYDRDRIAARLDQFLRRFLPKQTADAPPVVENSAPSIPLAATPIAESRRILEEYQRRDAVIPRDFYALNSPSNLYAYQCKQWALQGAFNKAHLFPLDTKRVLEVGCGSGHWLALLEMFGTDRANVSAIELGADRAEQCRIRFAGADIRTGDAADLPWDDATFDIVMQATMFTSILDPRVKQKAAQEMQRVLKPNGTILWYDFLYDNPWNKHVRGIKRREIRELFSDCDVKLRRVTLAPPISRRLASFSWTLCRLLEKVRLLNTHYMVIATKRASTRPGEISFRFRYEPGGDKLGTETPGSK